MTYRIIRLTLELASCRRCPAMSSYLLPGFECGGLTVCQTRAGHFALDVSVSESLPRSTLRALTRDFTSLRSVAEHAQDPGDPDSMCSSRSRLAELCWRGTLRIAVALEVYPTSLT